MMWTVVVEEAGGGVLGSLSLLGRELSRALAPPHQCCYAKDHVLSSCGTLGLLVAAVGFH